LICTNRHFKHTHTYTHKQPNTPTTTLSVNYPY